MAGLESEAILLEYDAIIDIIREISDGTVIVSTEELKNIQSKKAIEIYKALLFALYPGLSERLCSIPISDYAVGVKHPLLYEDSITLLGLTAALSRVFEACCVNNFTFRDLVAPKPKRTQRLFSFLGNYLRFCGSKQSVVDDAFSQANELKRCIEDREQQRNERLRRIEELKLEKAEEQRELALLKPDAENWRSKYNEMIQQQSEAEKLSEQEEQSLSNKEVILDILQTQDSIEELTALSEEHSSFLTKLSVKECQLRDFEEDCTAGLKLISSFATALGKRTDAARAMENLKERIRIQEQKLTDLLASIQNATRQHNMKVERLSRIQPQHQHWKVEKLAEIEVEKKKVSVLKAEIDAKVRHEFPAIESETSEISEQISLQRFEFEERARKTAECYGRLLDQLDAYHAILAMGFEKIMINISI